MLRLFTSLFLTLILAGAFAAPSQMAFAAQPALSLGEATPTISNLQWVTGTVEWPEFSIAMQKRVLTDLQTFLIGTPKAFYIPKDDPIFAPLNPEVTERGMTEAEYAHRLENEFVKPGVYRKK